MLKEKAKQKEFLKYHTQINFALYNIISDEEIKHNYFIKISMAIGFICQTQTLTFQVKIYKKNLDFESRRNIHYLVAIVVGKTVMKA